MKHLIIPLITVSAHSPVPCSLEYLAFYIFKLGNMSHLISFLSSIKEIHTSLIVNNVGDIFSCPYLPSELFF